jgi:hypothetical protein
MKEIPQILDCEELGEDLLVQSMSHWYTHAQHNSCRALTMASSALRL